MKIVIYGLAKTGTSALFYKLKNSLPPNTICLFEPQSWGRVSRLRTRLKMTLTGRGQRHVLAKVLPFWRGKPVQLEDFATFDKQILIVRDPRDRLISGLLYQVYNLDFFGRDDAVARFVGLLRQKEADPGSVSVLTLLDTIASLAGEPFSTAMWADDYGDRAIRKPLEFHRQRSHVHVFRYEDMVDGDFAALEKYLGMTLTGKAEVGPEVQRVVRRKTYGDWRNWFTEGDVEIIRPVLKPYLDRYYPGAEWHLNEAPRVSPEHASRYVERIVNERRAEDGLAPFHLS